MSWPLTWENVDIPWYTMALQFDFQTYVHELFNTIQHLATIMMFIRKSKRNWPPTSVLNLIPIGLLSFRSLPWNSNLSHNTIRFFPFVLWYFMISPFPKEIWKNILTHVTWSFTDFHLSLLSSRGAVHPPKFNMEPQKRCLDNYSPLGFGNFRNLMWKIGVYL